MFAYKRSLVAVISLLVIVFTVFLARQITDTYEYIFWVNVSALCLAEALVGASIITLMKTDQKGMPFQFLPLMLSGCYFVFTLLVPLICIFDISTIALTLIHCAGLLVFVACFFSIGIAHHSSVQLETEQKKSFSARTSFRNDLAFFKMKKDALLNADPELKRKYMQLNDEFQYASDSIPGSEDADTRISDELKNLIGCETTEDINKSLDELIALSKWRNSVIKNLR